MDNIHKAEVENKYTKNNHRKLEKTVLDNFVNLTNSEEKLRTKSSLNLLKHLIEQDNKKEIEISYALGRLIRGLGASTSSARIGFYSVLVSLINLDYRITLEQILQCVTKHLHTGGSNSKSENADISTGQILTGNAIIRSRLWEESTEDEKKRTIELVLNASKERSYLKLTAYFILISAFEKLNSNEFKKIFSLLEKEISRPLSEYNLDTLYFLWYLKKKFPDVLNRKIMGSLIQTDRILNSQNLDVLSDILLGSVKYSSVKHPIFVLLSKDIATSNILPNILTSLDSRLKNVNRNKLLIIMKLYALILKDLENKSAIPEILSPNFVAQVLNYIRNLKSRNDDLEFHQHLNIFFESLLEALKDSAVKEETRIEVLKKLLFSSNALFIEKLVGCKIIQQITSNLNSNGVKIVAGMYKGIITGTEKCNYSNKNSDNWYNNDRLYATHLLIKLLNHHSLRDENEWKIEYLDFLMNVALFKTDNGIHIGYELASQLKSAFFKATDLKINKLDDVVTIFTKLVQSLDLKLTQNQPDTVFRSPINEQDYELWQKTVHVVNKISKKKKSGLYTVFQTLFLQMALQLFNETKLAADSLNELHLCYEKIRSRKQKLDPNIDVELNKNENSSEPLWIEVVVDLFLSLLSHNSHLLRSLINSVFPHLCQYMSLATIHQILSVLCPINKANVLLSNNEDNISDDNETSEEDENYDDTDSEFDDDLMENETVNDKLRIALQEVLHTNDIQTDDESIDLDMLSDTEAEKLNGALSTVFRQFKGNYGNRKKQNKDETTLTHFRIRVLDLINIYLDSTPSLELVLEMIIPLLQAVEFSIKDEHQKPLLNRLNACLKKLSNLKKFNNVENVTEESLNEILRSILDKGTKNSWIVQDLATQITDCSIFIIKCSNFIITLKSPPKETSESLKKTGLKLIKRKLKQYFHERNSCVPFLLFKNIMQLNWEGVVSNIPFLLKYIFDDQYKIFKRKQALELLRLFYSNQRYLTRNVDKVRNKLFKPHIEFSEEIKNYFNRECENTEKDSSKETHLCFIFNLLVAMKNSCLKIDNIDWLTIAQSIQKYRNYTTFSRVSKSAFNKLCGSLGISNKSRKIHDDHESRNEQNINQETSKEIKEVRKSMKLKKDANKLRLENLSSGLDNVDLAYVDSLNMEDTNQHPTHCNGMQVENVPVSHKLKNEKRKCVEINNGESVLRKKSKKSKLQY